jgi:hypothetical protein
MRRRKNENVCMTGKRRKFEQKRRSERYSQCRSRSRCRVEHIGVGYNDKHTTQCYSLFLWMKKKNWISRSRAVGEENCMNKKLFFIFISLFLSNTFSFAHQFSPTKFFMRENSHNIFTKCTSFLSLRHEL